MLQLFLGHQLGKYFALCGGMATPEAVQSTFLRSSAHVSLRDSLEHVAYYDSGNRAWRRIGGESDETSLRSLRGTLTPEATCQLLGMFEGLQALRDSGVVASAVVGSAQTSVNRLTRAIDALHDRLDPTKMTQRRHGILGIVAQAAKERDLPGEQGGGGP